MEKKYINESRYKRTSPVSRKKRIAKKTLKKQKSNSVISKSRNIPIRKKTINMRKTKIVKILVYFVLTVFILSIARIITKDPKAPFIPNIFEKKYVNEQVVKIGTIDSNLDNKNVNNIIIQELNTYVYPMLLRVDSNYNISYEIIESATKISNKEYLIKIKDNYKVTAEEVKVSLNEYRKSSNVYYNNVKNISSISLKDNLSLSIKLKRDDPMFIYNLNLPIQNTMYDMSNYYISSSRKSKVIYQRREEANKALIKEIQVISYSSLEDEIEAFKEGKINMFFSNLERVKNLDEKYSYSIKEYRGGKNLFLLMNKNIKALQNENIRQAISFSINKENIIKKVYPSQSTGIINIPYIYDNTQTNYDIYKAENLIIAEGYIKKQGIYTKVKNGKTEALSFGLLVNKKDNEKVKVAEYIKSNLKQIGIEVDIYKQSENEISKNVASNKYDLTLADINLNSNPDISFISKYMCLSEEEKSIINKINVESIDNISTNITNLIENISVSVPIIGIKSDNIYIIYNKSLSKIKNINYMLIFKDLMN